MVLDGRHIEAIYRLSHGQGWSVRKIARHLKLSRKSVRKYLAQPAPAPVQRSRASKLDPYKERIGQLLEEDPSASAVVIAQRLREQGYPGGITILREYLKGIRPGRSPRAFVRVESAPGERFEVDWGHFGALDYQGDKRKLYAFVLVECHSRRLYLEFTHSQSFETFARCHIHAFRFMQGIAREVLFDNLASAVAEREGRWVRFNPRFLELARLYGFFPRACTPGSPWEKGKIERLLGYVRQNFWPLRSFTGLADLNHQARQWRDQVANQRLHRETREQPQVRFQPQALRPLPELDPDYRETAQPLVHKDLRLYFDGNRYCAPARWVGRRLTLKADSDSVSLYDRNRLIVAYPRCWRRGQTFGAERFEKQLREHRPAARSSPSQQRLIALLGEPAEAYLRALAEGQRPLAPHLDQLLELTRQYDPQAVVQALQEAAAQKAFGAEYVAHLLRQQQNPRHLQPPLQLKDPRLNELATDPLSLLEYDAFIFRERKKP